MLGIGLAFLVEYLDKRIKDEKTLERVTGLPVLASVPAVGGKWKNTKKGQRSDSVIGFEGSSSVLLESFRTLRSSLQYFDRGRDSQHASSSPAGCPGGQDRHHGQPGHQPGALRPAGHRPRGRSCGAR